MLMIPPHVFFKQVNDGRQSSWILQNGTDVSATQRFVLNIHYSEDDRDIPPLSRLVPSNA